MTRCLIFPSPQLTLAGPGPARPQGTVYQGDRAPDSLRCLLRRWPELRGSLIDKRRQEDDAPRDRGLIHIEDLRPHLLGDVMAHIPTGDDERLA